MGIPVEIIVNQKESGDQGVFNRFIGEIVGKIRDNNGKGYHIVEAKKSLSFADVNDRKSVEGTYLVITPKSLDDSLEEGTAFPEKDIPIGIARVLDNSIMESETFDTSQVGFFAIGYLRYVGTG